MPSVGGQVCDGVPSSALVEGDVALSAVCSQTSRCSLLRRAANDEARRAFFSPSASSLGDDPRWNKASAKNSEDAVKVSQSQEFDNPARNRLQSTR